MGYIEIPPPKHKVWRFITVTQNVFSWFVDQTHIFFINPKRCNTQNDHFMVVVSIIIFFHPYLGKISILTNIFQMGWNHQSAISWGFFNWESCSTGWTLTNLCCPLCCEIFGLDLETFPPITQQMCQMSNEKNLAWLGYTRDYTTQLYRDYNEPL